MATSTAEDRAAAKVEAEGAELLGQPTFTELDNGRFRCVETGHEVLTKDKDSYSRTKRCRLGLIDFAVSHRKAPLNMFEQDPLSRSKLKCKLTSDTINKTEEHIWKHINGKRFLNKLEQKELEKESMAKSGEQQGKKKAAKASKPSTENPKKKKEKEKEKEQEKTISEAQEANGESDPEDDFWMPPAGQRWDSDDGGDRWGSGSDSEHESDKVIAMDDEDKDDKDGENKTDEDIHGENKSDEDKHGEVESDELSKRTKRMSIEIGPSSFASRKKKSKKSAV